MSLAIIGRLCIIKMSKKVSLIKFIRPPRECDMSALSESALVYFPIGKLTVGLELWHELKKKLL